MNREEVNKYFEFEKSMNTYMDKYYKNLGFSIDWDGNKEYDCILHKENKSPVKVELKYRKKIYNDILVEVIQDMKTNHPGWLYTSNSRYLHYVICTKKPEYYYSLKFKLFKKWFFEHIKSNKVSFIISKKGWGLTLNMPISVFKIPDNIIKKIDIISR